MGYKNDFEDDIINDWCDYDHYNHYDDYADYDRDTFYALTDGMYGDYEDYCDIDSVMDFMGY